jgi:DNA (cytosine-5)-methyltransferase 1
MMGLPDGWVTDPSMKISRTQQLIILGNGVVPLQGLIAIRSLR